MRRNNNIFRATIAVAVLAPFAAMAQVDTSEWNCEYCPFEDGYRAEVDAGVGYVSEDAARFGNGTGLDEKGAVIELAGEGRYLKDGTEVTWYAEDLGVDSRVLEISAGKPGKFEVGLGYRELPYRLFGSTSTPFSTSGDTLSLPAGWVTAPATSGFTALDASLSPQNIEKDRQILEFGARYLPTSKVKLYADYRRQQRDGVSIMSGSSFTQGAFLPRPVDDYTDQLDAGVRFSAGSFNLALAYYGSFYGKPDNEFQQFSLSGVYRATTFNTVVAFSAAMGRGEQKSNFLPYTINPTLVTSPLPATSLGGQVDTSNYALTITSRPHKRASIKLSYRFDERDNQTTISSWSRVIVDTFLSGPAEANIPYSFERSRLNLSATFKLFDTVTVSGGYDRTDLDRDFQEQSKPKIRAGAKSAGGPPQIWKQRSRAAPRPGNSTITTPMLA